MHFDYAFYYVNFTKLVVALLLGGIIGAEREYKGRNIGFRTIILITMGSALFTILSLIIGGGNDPTRIASNVVTGVGFLGAGAIFRDGATVRGITTASIIWISAAIGMACGMGQYEFAVMVTGMVMIILLGFAGVQNFIDRYNQEKVYRITIANSMEFKKEFEEKVLAHGLKFQWLSHTKLNDELVIEYEIRGGQSNHDKFLGYLTGESRIKNFHV